MIDFILLATGREQLIYCGISQGGTTIMILLTERPEYNKKVSLVHYMAGAIYLKSHPPLIDPLLKTRDQIKVEIYT